MPMHRDCGAGPKPAQPRHHGSATIVLLIQHLPEPRAGCCRRRTLRVRKLAMVVLMTGPLFAGGVYAQQTANKDSVYEELNLFDEAFERIRQDAVDPVTDAKLIGAAIAGMLSGLDAHSSYLGPEEFKSSQLPAGEDAANLGLVVTIESGQLKVISPQAGS